MSGRTFAIGDIHGDLEAFERLLERLPDLDAEDTVVFLGDYIDRGPRSFAVVERVRRFVAETTARTVTLRGNHEQGWLNSVPEADIGFLLPRGNGTQETYRSFTGGPPLAPESGLEIDEMRRMIDVKAWFPADVLAWFEACPLWHEDEHALYVHAGLDHDGPIWKHPRDSRPQPLLWMREREFFAEYEGKRVVFGHTRVVDLPTEHIGPIRRLFDDPCDVWTRGPLIGVDTGCGKGGFLSAVELPKLRVYESR